MSTAPGTSPQRVARTPQFRATVTGAANLSPRMRRVTVTSPEIGTQSWPLGCDLAVILTGEDGREVRRRYTARSVLGDSLVIDAVLHGPGPGSTWAAAASVGDEVELFGPRGEVPLTDAAHVVAITDESGLPAIAALAERLTGSLAVLAEVADEGEIYPVPEHVQVSWLSRGDQPAGDPGVQLSALDRLPPDAEYAYVIGESRSVVAIREALEARGLHRTAIYYKGYWNLRSRATR